MTKTARHFPATLRAATVAALVILLSVAATFAGAAPSRQGVERAKERIRKIEGQLAAIREELASTQLRLNGAADRVEEHEIALEEVEVDLARTRAARDRAEARYERIVDRLNERAVEAYIQGPATSMDFLLGSQTISDLTDRLAYVDALAQSDADLAVRVANLKNRLTVIEGQLEDDQARQIRQLEAARVQKEQVLGLFQDVQRLLDRQQGLLASAERVYRKQKAAYADFLEEQRSQGVAIGGRVWNGGSLPEPYDQVLTACPVDQPRAFGDGFGAPRYAGGYHLHKGVDVVAPAGTAILAAFDGYAYTSANTLGGNVVFVVGQYGKVYNAHLSRYSELSNGRVSAGDVIGYVGDTGDATGIPHDHFEFHPNAMPGPWPVSSYGYSVIEDAINPYPLLIQACG